MHCQKTKQETFPIPSLTPAAPEREIVYDFVSKIRPNTRMAVVTLASNVCGKILPIASLADICRKRNILLICDASQAAGCVPINVKALGVDVLCFAGHKSLYGPPGAAAALYSVLTKIRSRSLKAETA